MITGTVTAHQLSLQACAHFDLEFMGQLLKTDQLHKPGADQAIAPLGQEEKLAAVW